MAETNETSTRVRMNLSLTAKGKVQWDITSEFPTVEDAAENLSKAIDSVRKVIADKGLSEAGTE